MEWKPRYSVLVLSEMPSVAPLVLAVTVFHDFESMW